MITTTTIESYLSKKWIYHYRSGKEIVAHCVFNDCDKDSHGKEAHLYIDSTTWCYQCKKCLEQGNWITLLKHLWDDPGEYPLEWYNSPVKPDISEPIKKKISITEKDVAKYQKALPGKIREYLHERGITDELITERQLGYSSFYGANWITIPIRDISGELAFFKLRRDPYGPEGNKYMFYPTGSEAMLYGAENLIKNDDYIVICEWEFDQMILWKEWIIGITSTGGVGTFKEEWISHFSTLSRIYICFDGDEAGKKWADKIISRLSIRFPEKEIYRISLPEDKGKDISEYFRNWGNIDDMMLRYSELVQGTDITKFSPMKWSELIEILSLTIKHDNINKLIVFLAMLSAYTEESQFNILLNAPSSSGKSYIPLEIAKLFPEDSLMKLQYVSQNAFFHESGEYDKEKNQMHIRLNRKIIIFIDQPRTDLLSRLRPILSHDEKVMISKITDKTGKWGNKTKSVVIHGYPVAIFCTASTGLDEQEATRFLLLSPETHNAKLRDTVHAKIFSESESQETVQSIEENPARILLKERIELIRDAHIDSIKISNHEEVEKLFLSGKTHLKPRHQRDVSRFMSLIKMFTLLNLPFRKRVDNTLYTEQEDIDEAWKIWEEIAPGQEYNISPYSMQIYRDVFIPAYREYNINEKDFFTPEDAKWVPRKYIIKKHSELYGRPLSDATWRQELEPTLVNAGLIITETAGRNIHVSPTEEIHWNIT